MTNSINHVTEKVAKKSLSNNILLIVYVKYVTKDIEKYMRHTVNILIKIVVWDHSKPFPGPNPLSLPIRSNRPDKGDPA